VEVLFSIDPIWAMISGVGRFIRVHPGEILMHELLIAIAFLGMIIAPAIVAVNPGSASQVK
jgi:hypothetical protein